MNARELLEVMHVDVRHVPTGCTPSCEVFINGAKVSGAAHILGEHAEELHLWYAWHGKAVDDERAC